MLNLINRHSKVFIDMPQKEQTFPKSSSQTPYRYFLTTKEWTEDSFFQTSTQRSLPTSSHDHHKANDSFVHRWGFKKKTFFTYQPSSSFEILKKQRFLHPALALEGDIVGMGEIAGHTHSEISSSLISSPGQFSSLAPSSSEYSIVIDLDLPITCFKKSQGLGIIFCSLWRENQTLLPPLSSFQVFFISKKSSPTPLWNYWKGHVSSIGHYLRPFLLSQNPSITQWIPHGPAKAELKIRELWDLFFQDFFQKLHPDQHHILELGAAPGGVTSYFLNKNFSVVSVDPANLPLIQHPKWSHYKMSLQEFSTEKNLNHYTNRWKDHVAHSLFVVVDINLDPNYIFPFLKYILNTLKKNLLGLLFILKITKHHQESNLQQIHDELQHFFTDISKPFHLYWNAHEFTLLCWNK
jgi:23S rRNA U2552 (ribose-2'-O)-methylase RlmE/FtsJ